MGTASSKPGNILSYGDDPDPTEVSRSLSSEILATNFGILRPTVAIEKGTRGPSVCIKDTTLRMMRCCWAEGVLLSSFSSMKTPPLHQKFRANTIRQRARRKCSFALWLDDNPEGILSNTPVHGRGIGKADEVATEASRDKWMDERAKAANGVLLRNTKVTRLAHHFERERDSEKGAWALSPAS